MSFIDWSDSEGMFDLFQEFIRDEMNESFDDPERQQFLRNLLAEISSLNQMTIADAILKLRTIHDSIPGEFQTDSAFLHLRDLITELERST